MDFDLFKVGPLNKQIYSNNIANAHNIIFVRSVEVPSKPQTIILNTFMAANIFKIKFSLAQLYWGIVYI